MTNSKVGIRHWLNMTSSKQDNPVLTKFYILLTVHLGTILVNNQLDALRGGVVVKALRYKPASRGYDSRWCHWNFSVA